MCVGGAKKGKMNIESPLTANCPLKSQYRYGGLCVQFVYVSIDLYQNQTPPQHITHTHKFDLFNHNNS